MPTSTPARAATPPWRVALADDHALLIEALSLLLPPVGTVCGSASEGSELLAVVERESPDVVITDLSMPGMSGFEVLRAIAQRPSSPPVVVLTVHADVGTLRAAFAAGAAGYVVKSAASSELITAITTVMRGERYIPPSLRDLFVAAPASAVEMLSVRQRAVLEVLARGLSNKEAAAALGISERTVGFHKLKLRQLLGVHSILEMMDLLRRTSGYAADGVGQVD